MGVPASKITRKIELHPNRIPGGSHNIYIFDKNYNELWSTTVYDSGKITSPIIGLPQGDVYIEIYGSNTNDYNLYLSYNSADNWEKEVNGSFDKANSVNRNTKIYGSNYDSSDYDYYKIKIPSTGYINVSVNRTPYNSHNIYLYDKNYSCLWDTTVYSEGIVNSSPYKVSAGYVYLMIYGSNTDKYSFTVSYSQGSSYKPKSTKITAIYGISKGLKVVWKKQTGNITGYQLQFSQSSSFSSGVKSVKIYSSGTTKTNITGLKKNAKYYVRIRTFYTTNGTTYYSAWSATDYGYSE